MPAPIRYVQDSRQLPDQADVVVIGAGIAGAAAAYELAKKRRQRVAAGKRAGRWRAIQSQLGMVPTAKPR
ncbi:hypothetical protein OS31_39580 [Dickeya oryzae]